MLKRAALADDIHYASLMEVSGLIARGELSPVALTGAMLSRIDALNPALNAYLLVTSESALAEAATAEAEITAGRWRGPLHGVPIGLKDLFETRGVPATFGTISQKVVSDRDATIVHRLKQAGAVILGHLHLHEGAFADHHPLLGNCINPWNADYWPGGSSSGSGSATAAGLCYASLGTDTGGSIRFPSAACGVTGLKVTWGRTSRFGVFALAKSLDTIGPIARSAADCAAMLSAFAGPDPNDPTCLDAPVPHYLAELEGVYGARDLKIGVDEVYLSDGVDPEVVSALSHAIDTFRDIGATIVSVSVPDFTEAIRAAGVIIDAECACYHRAAFAEKKDEYGPALRGAVERGFGYDPTLLAGAYIRKDRFRGEFRRCLSGIDALVSPVYGGVGIRYDHMQAALTDLNSFVRYTAPFNFAGVPSVTFPCGLATVGMPIGVQLVGGHLGESTLLRAAHAFQQATDWHLRHPMHS